MSKFIKVLSVTLISILVIVGVGFVYLKNHLSVKSSGRLQFAALHGSVSIYRDKFGVPHINAEKSDEDAFFALGYVHAQDRFWQMEFQRRVVSGTLSEIFGKKTLPMDEYLRTYGFYEAAQNAWNAFDKPTQQLIISYTAGINAYIKQGNFPLEVSILHYQPKPWTVIDSIAWQKMMSWNLQNHSWTNKILYSLARINFGKSAINEYFPDYPEHAPVILSNQHNPVYAHQKSLAEIAHADEIAREKLNLTQSPGLGSNGWVVAGSRTTSGKPLLANDIHLSLTAPNLWYLVELRGPHLHVTGATIPGMPAIAIGHNDKIAWGVTNGYNDATELYVLANNDKITLHDEVIHVRHSKDIHYNVLRSEFGPVINKVTPELTSSHQNIALQWPALMANDTTVQSFIKINYANNWRQFQNALQDFVTPTQNFLYADTDGNIGYYYPGHLPARKWKSLLPVPTLTKFQWHGFIPFAQLPHEFNPATGVVATANNKVTSDNYPYSINARWPVTSYRIDRIMQMLQQKQRLSIADMTNVQADVTSNFWLELKPLLLQVKPQDELSRTAVHLLQTWSGKMDTTSVAPTIFAYWLNSFSDLVPTILHQPGKTIEPTYLVHRLQKGLSPTYLQNSLKQAMKTLAHDHGHDPKNWRWGNIHNAAFIGNGFGKIPFLNRIWNRSIDSQGGNYTVNVGGYDPDTFTQNKGATYRQIIDVKDFNNSLYIIPMGQSGNPFSTHYSDLLSAWRDIKYITIKSTPAC